MVFLRATERRRYERELIEARAAADAARGELEQSLAAEREVAKFREQFIAVLGHDLRNPVAAFSAGAKLLSRQTLDDKSRNILSVMRGSVVRMGGLIDNVLDFARARLGGGLKVEIDRTQPLRPELEQVIREFQAVHTDREICARFSFADPVDPARLAQMFSNLLGNALTHGTPHTPVEVFASSNDVAFTLSVENASEPIPADLLESLFQPFFRAKASGHEGLGLGLFIASEIARAHGGTLDASSAGGKTRFTFRLPFAGVPAQAAPPV
ncbi:HAMP domain-containing sensor histidine kinase [Mesorhizobium sp. CN2-181]|uniref:sensor histidine kinase n=1 Tax=Mesorhizobium yinganensis TaxID=3157707 RepID=UPI0032B85D9B